MRGWCLGSEEFRRELLVKVEGRRGPNHLGGEWRESQGERAERLLARELASQGGSEADLEGGLKTDAIKVRIARILRKETTMTLPWIARRLRMGSVHTLRNALQG